MQHELRGRTGLPGEHPRGRGQPEREHCEIEVLFVPFEPEEAGRILVHGEVVIGRRDVRRATPTGLTEEGPALALEGLHAEALVRQVRVHVAAVPDETALTHAVECDTQGEDAVQSLGAAGHHGAQRDPFRDGRRDEVFVLERGPCVREAYAGRLA